MRLASLLVAFPLLLTGCPDDSDSEPGPAEPEPPPAPQRVVVETVDLPALIAYREGDGAWKALTERSSTTFAFDVTGPYSVTTVCDDGAGQIDVYQIARTLDDDRTMTTACHSAPELTLVGGTMLQVGQAAMESVQTDARASDGHFELGVPRGTYDLVATSGSAIAIYRDVVVDSASTPPTMNLPFDVDLVADGKPLVVPQLGVDSLPEEFVHAFVTLDTGLTRATIYSSHPSSVRVAPDDVLAATDRQVVEISAHRSQNQRRFLRRVSAPVRGGDSTRLELPEHIGPVEFTVAQDVFQVTWSHLPDHDVLTADLSGGGIAHHLALSAHHAAATRATALTFDAADIPGFRPEWRIDATRQGIHSVTAVRVRGEMTFESMTLD